MEEMGKGGKEEKTKRKEGGKEGKKDGRKEERKEGRRGGGKEGRRERGKAERRKGGRKEGRKERKKEGGGGEYKTQPWNINKKTIWEIPSGEILFITRTKAPRSGGAAVLRCVFCGKTKFSYKLITCH